MYRYKHKSDLQAFILKGLAWEMKKENITTLEYICSMRFSFKGSPGLKVI